MSKITYRRARASDHKGIAKLLRGGGLAGKWLTKSLFGKMLRKNRGLYFVAEHDSSIVGCVFGTHDGGYMGYVYKLAVDPDHRGKGVAKTLVKKVLAEFRKRGTRWMYTLIMKENIPSRKIFEKYGFKVRRTHLLFEKGNVL